MQPSKNASRFMYNAFLIALLITCVGAGCSEPPNTDSQSSPVPAEPSQAEQAQARLEASDGGQLVLRAIEAHGGLDAWYDAPTSAYAWEYSNTGANLRFKSYLVADNRTRQIYHNLLELGTPDDPQPIEGRYAWTGEEAWISPASMERINPRFWALTDYYFQSIPFILADPGLTYELLPPENLDGILYDMVRVGYERGIGDSPGDTYTLYVDQETDMLKAIRYTVTYGRDEPPESPRETLLYYEDYITVDGLTVPTHFRGFSFANGEKGEARSEAWATDISFRQPFDASKLEMPEDGRVQPMPGS